MKPDAAVILAAGLGTRLRDSHSGLPKGFLRLGDTPIVLESINRLRLAGVQKIIIVTGHLSEFYEELAAGDADISTVHNPQYAESGSMYSLWCARDRVNGSFLLLESDLIYEQRALDVLLAGPAEAILLSGTTLAGDEVYVETEGEGSNSRLYAMSKDASALGADPAGELVGISLISPELFRYMLEYTETELRQENLKVDYETDALVHAGRQMPVACPVVVDLIWSEIDDSTHLERARQSIYPQLQAKSA
ncbi:MAG: choline kinase [Gammaproteobacteria bacterium]|jgi:choline kinase